MCARKTDGHNGDALLSAVNENMNGIKASKPDIKGVLRNNSAVSLIICSFCTISIFLVDWDLTSLEQCRRAFRLALNPQKEHGPLWIWLWKFSFYQLCVRGVCASRLFRSKIRALVSGCDPIWGTLSGIMVSFMTQSKDEDTSPSQSCRKSSEHAMKRLSRVHVTSVFPVSGQQLTPSSFLQRGSRQLVGQRVPALHFLALVLQTVYPVLESVSLWVTA